jgi:hypothetical protein
MNAGEIATIRFPSIREGNRLTSTGMASGVPTVTTKESMLRLLDAEISLASMIDPTNSFPPNARQIASHADSLKHDITDGMCTVKDAEMIVRAAAELTSANETCTRLTGSTHENDHGPWLDHDPTQSQNVRDLVQHTAGNASESVGTVTVPSAGTTRNQTDVDVLGQVANALLPVLQASMPCITIIRAMDDVSFPVLQAGVPTIATDDAREKRCGDPKSRGEPKSDFCWGGCHPVSVQAFLFLCWVNVLPARHLIAPTRRCLAHSNATHKQLNAMNDVPTRCHCVPTAENQMTSSLF